MGTYVQNNQFTAEHRHHNVNVKRNNVVCRFVLFCRRWRASLITGYKSYPILELIGDGLLEVL